MMTNNSEKLEKLLKKKEETQRLLGEIKTGPNRDKALVICIYGASSTQECFDLVRGAFEIRGFKLGNVYCTDILAKTFKPSWYPSEMKKQYLNWIDYLKEIYKL